MQMCKRFFPVVVAGLIASCAGAPKTDAVPFGVETGLWEVTAEMKQGRTPLPPTVLGRLSPEGRKDYEEYLRKSASIPKVRSTRICVTPEDLEAGVFNALLKAPETRCKYKVKSGTATHQDVDLKCQGDGGPYLRHVTLDADSRESVRSILVAPNRDLPTIIEMNGKWLRSSCQE
jgi:Protein of unknown function (DUF3617)